MLRSLLRRLAGALVCLAVAGAAQGQSERDTYNAGIPSLGYASRLIDVSGDGSSLSGSQFGDPANPDYEPWSALINSFGQKVCGPAESASTRSGASLVRYGSRSVAATDAGLWATLCRGGPGTSKLGSGTRTPCTHRI